MINPISFGSTYKVHTSSKENELRAFDKFQDLCANKERKEDVLTKYEDSICPKYPYHWEATQTLVVPEYMDSEVEAYCKNRGIEFKKLTSYKLMDLDSIEKRIKKAPNDMVKTTVDVEKLEKLLINQDSNLEHCERDFNNFYTKKVDLMLKSGDKFPTTTLHIVPNFSSIEDTLEYIEKFGKENLNDDMISILFSQQTNEPDNCVYFALKDLGMDKIPVYVNKDSYAIGNALGLFE